MPFESAASKSYAEVIILNISILIPPRHRLECIEYLHLHCCVHISSNLLTLRILETLSFNFHPKL